MTLSPVIKLLESCNLACTYCYQEDLLGPKRVMAEETLDRVLSELARITRGPVQILWFGGEPTLVGLKYFRRALDAAYGHFGPRLRHAIQTNATLLDDDWAALLAEHRFAVTVSLDGPADVHDACRIHPRGRGSHADVMRGLQALSRHGLRARASCVVTDDTLPHAERILDFFASLDLWEVDFPPAMRHRADAFETLVDARAYGRFMVRILERWLAMGRKDFRVRSLAGLARAIAGKPPSFCKLEGGCSRYVTFSYQGDVYPCDEFTGIEGHRLGSVLATPLDEILATPRAREIQRRWSTVPEACGDCEWHDLCRGGCPFERRVSGGVEERSAVCEGLKILYARMAREIPAAAACPSS